MVHGPVREVVRGPGPLDWSTDRGSVFSGHPCRRVLFPLLHVASKVQQENCGLTKPGPYKVELNAHELHEYLTF